MTSLYNKISLGEVQSRFACSQVVLTRNYNLKFNSAVELIQPFAKFFLFSCLVSCAYVQGFPTPIHLAFENYSQTKPQLLISELKLVHVLRIFNQRTT